MIYKKLLSFKQVMSANDTKDNLAEVIEESDRTSIAAEVIARKDTDKKTMESWLDTVRIGLDLVRLNYDAKVKPFEDSYNIQFPLMLNAVLSVSSRIFNEIHREIYLAHPNIIGADPDEAKEKRAQNVKEYIQALFIDNHYSNWLEEMSKMYPRLTLMGTQIKQVVFDPSTMCFHNDFVPYTDIYIHNKSSCIEKAPAITKCVYLSQNEVVERINRGLFVDYDFLKKKNSTEAYSGMDSGSNGTYDDGTEMLYDRTYKILEQHCWMDLDGDNYAEPYIAFVDEEAGKLLRLVPRIDKVLSQFDNPTPTTVAPIKLEAEKYFVDFHYMPDIDGNFWSIGLAQMLGSTNMIINELMNNMANVATIATRQGGLLGLGGRGAQGRQRIDMTKYNAIQGNPDDIRKALIQFDIKDPSPVIMQLTSMLIETGEKMGALNESLSGEMPNREVPAQTMLMIVEQSLKNAQAIYRRVHCALTKELNIASTAIRNNGDNQHYQQVIGDPQANLNVDFDTSSMTISMNSDASSSTSSERLMKLLALKDIVSQPIQNPYINGKEYTKRLFQAIDTADIDKIVVDPPEPQPSVQEQAIMKDLEIKEKKVEDHKEIADTKAILQAAKDAANSKVLEAQAAMYLAQSNTHAVQQAHDIFMEAKAMEAKAAQVAIDQYNLERQEELEEQRAAQEAAMKQQQQTGGNQ